MVDELVDENDIFLDLSPLMIRILAIIQKTLMELENLLVMSSALQYRYINPHCVPPTNSSLDCSAYFEPIIDPTRLASERSESADCCAPDFCDYFEPVALR